MSRTVSDVFGQEAADRLAALAINIACAAPEHITTATTRVSARMMNELREAVEEAGIDWRALVRARIERQRERS
jgi:hypothetical protein